MICTVVGERAGMGPPVLQSTPALPSGTVLAVSPGFPRSLHFHLASHPSPLHIHASEGTGWPHPRAPWVPPTGKPKVELGEREEAGPRLPPGPLEPPRYWPAASPMLLLHPPIADAAQSPALSPALLARPFWPDPVIFSFCLQTQPQQRRQQSPALPWMCSSRCQMYVHGRSMVWGLEKVLTQGWGCLRRQRGRPQAGNR